MKDDFDEDFLDLDHQENSSNIHKIKSGRTLSVDVKQFEIFKSDGICEREFYNYENCKANANSTNINKSFCDKVTNLLIQCITRSGKDIFK
jgi:hypothetical protein